MTNKQPEALRIADLLGKEIHRTVYVDVLHQDAINELRRLQEVNTELVGALNYVIRDLEMRSNLKRGDEKGEVDIRHGAYLQAKAALAKATGDNND